jgi:hypothetical protein
VTRGDRIIVIAIALAALLAWPVLRLASASTAEVARISGPGGESELRLDAGRTVQVQGLHGTVTVSVGPSGARVISSTCPDKLCVQQGVVGAGGSIVCAPNGVSIRVGGGSNALDAVVR